MSTTVARQYLGGITAGTMYRMLKSGELPARRVGRYLFIERRQLTGYIERQRIRPRAERQRRPS